MSAPDLVFYDSSDAAPLGPLTITATPGLPGAPIEVHLWNQKGGATAETSRGGRLMVLVRDPGETYWSGSGRQPVDEGWIVAELVGAQGGAAVVLTGPTPLGRGAWLRVQDIPANSAVHVQFWPDVPMTIDSLSPVTFEIYLTVDDRLALALGSGHTEAGGDGIFSGVGDGAYSALIRGGVVTPSGTPDANVHVPYFSWISSGVPLAVAAATVALSGNDGDAAALAGGDEYQALIAAAPSGIVVVKGSKATAGSAVRPAIPAEHQPIAWVLRDFAGAIDAAHITNVYALGRFAVSTDALVATLGPGSGRVDNYLVDLAYAQVLPALVDATTNYLWLSPSGATVNQTADRPEPRALLLWELGTSGGAVVAVRDRRPLLPAGERRALRFSSALTTGDHSPQEVNESPLPLYLDPERPVALALADLGSGHTTGVHRVDVEILADDGTATSIFPDTASMPQIAFGATSPVTSASAPATLAIPAGARFRARVDAVPDGTPAAGALVVVR